MVDYGFGRRTLTIGRDADPAPTLAEMGTGPEPDPRASSGRVPDDPAALLGVEIAPVELVQIDGEDVLIPRLPPGAAEFATATGAEAAADELLPEVLAAFDCGGGIPTADFTLAIDFRLKARTAVATAVAGLEAFANFHLERLTPETVKEASDLSLVRRYGEALPDAFGVASPKHEPWWPKFRQLQGLVALQRRGVERATGHAGLDGIATLQQRYYDREYIGSAQIMLDAFDHFMPGWISGGQQQRLRDIAGG
jgi:hypothetical protein